VRVVRRAGPFDGELVEARLERAQRLAEARQTALDAYLSLGTCRWQQLAGYYGEATEPCGTCGSCRSGGTVAVDQPDAVEAGDVVLVPGLRVVHDAFGTGTVTQLAEDEVSISFDEAGARRFDVEVLASADLLEPAEPAAGPQN